ERRLEVLQPSGERRLRDVERVRGGLEAAVLADRDEGLHAERIDLHEKNASIAAMNSFYEKPAAGQDTRPRVRLRSALQSTMPEPTALLTRELLEWIANRPRTYADVLDAWRSSCPRLSIWEDACIDGLVDYDPGTRIVSVSDRGRSWLGARA